MELAREKLSKNDESCKGRKARYLKPAAQNKLGIGSVVLLFGKWRNIFPHSRSMPLESNSLAQSTTG